MSKALKAAIDSNDADAVRKALKTVKDLSRKLPKALAPLEYACTQGADAVVEVLLVAGAPVADGYVGNHPFSLAAERGRVNVLERFAARGVTMDVVEHAFQNALLTGQVDVARFILERCKPPLTAHFVELATWWENGLLLDLLVEHGADVNVPNDGEVNYDMKGVRAIHRAADGGHVRAIEMLADHGADVNVVDAAGLTPLMHLARHMPDLLRAAQNQSEMSEAQRDVMAKLAAEGQFPRHGDREAGNGMKSARLLLKLGGNAAATDQFGHDALVHYEWERRSNREEPSKEFIELMTGAGATGGGATAELYWALWDRDLAAVTSAIAAGADVNRPSPGGFTPLVLARTLDQVDMLLKAGADPNLPSKNSTPLTSAARGGELAIVQRLVAAGADIHAIEPRPPKSEYMANAYSAAEQNRKYDVAEYLKSLGAGMPKRKEWKPLEAGVESWNDFSEILVKDEVPAVAKVLAAMIQGNAELQAYGKQFLPGERAFVVLRPRGMRWCNVFRIAPLPRRFEDPQVVGDLCGEIAKACAAPVLSVGYSDTSDAADVVRFEPDGTSVRDDSMDGEMLEELVGAMGDEAPDWAIARLEALDEKSPDSTQTLQELARNELFVVVALGLQCEPGREVDVDFTSYPAEAFDGVAFVSSQ